MQSLIAISEVIKQITSQNQDYLEIEPKDLYDRFLLISLGTGSDRSELKYNAKKASKWNVISWLYTNGSTPLLDCFDEATCDMVDYHNSAVFQALRSEQNYFRIDVSLKYLVKNEKRNGIKRAYNYIYK